MGRCVSVPLPAQDALKDELEDVKDSRDDLQTQCEQMRTRCGSSASRSLHSPANWRRFPFGPRQS